MGKLLTILGITDQSNLTEDILTAENLIIGMQYIYENSPESEQKESLAIAIAETIRLTLQQIKGLPLTPPQAPQVISNKPRILTEVEMAVIYGLAWRTEVALDDKNHNADWVSPNMDKYLGTELTDTQLEDLNSKGYADLDDNKIFIATIFMTTLNPSYNKNGVQGGDNYQSADGLFKFHIDGVVNGVVFYKQTDEFGVETDEEDNLYIINDLIDDGEWVKVNKQTIVQVGDMFQHAKEPHEPAYMVVNIENGKVTIAWTKNSTVRAVDYDIQEVIEYINNGVWIKINNQQSTPTTPKSDTEPLFEIGDKFLVDTWDKNEVGIITSITEKNVNYDFSYDKGLAWESGNNFQKSNFEKWLKKGEVVILPTPKPTAKKGTRQSPITSATAVKEGTKMKGNDGNFWVARKTSAGYNQWKKIK